MSSITETGYLKINLKVSIMGPMGTDKALEIEKKFKQFLKKQDYDVEGEFHHVQIISTDFRNHSKFITKDTNVPVGDTGTTSTQTSQLS